MFVLAKLTCFPRRKDSCPYKEDLFKSCDWASYRNALQKWQKQYKLFQTIPTIPEIILLLKQHDHIFTDRKLSCENRKQKKDIYINNPGKTNTQDLQKSFSSKYDAKGKNILTKYKMIVPSIYIWLISWPQNIINKYIY